MILFDAAIAFAVVSLMVGCILQVMRSQQDAIGAGAGLPGMLSRADGEVHAFTANAYAGAPATAPTTAGTTDAGQSLQAMRATSYNATLGLRTYAVSIFVAGSPRAVLAGAARLEPLSQPDWSPDLSAAAGGSSAHVLTVTSANLALGTAAGTGTYAFGTVVPIRATPALGHVFIGWTGNALIANPAAA
ncbi:MAG: hypothetical protein PHE83_18455, partial [Opitutaceae bacterium]|nr:hypothetical protein [Opitutaceae bacterium]